jgi:arsenate reductase
MAEGLVRSMYPDRYDVFSAGVKPTMINPHAVKVMNEIGVDISKQQSKSFAQFNDTHFDYVVTVCDATKEVCPFFSNAKQLLHRNFEDPAAVMGSSTITLAKFRKVRNEIRSWIERTFGQGE